ncbi:high frequency lysogenization protein HflD [Mariprofundus ferrooxydans]|uniref:high frequency lysogenization protein HflD n=1 Tax=Mariprofundus ferrooxydans TaxID=314344 RepID=UPI0003618D18|nr:high frequency lysogenization protein HflD [Mariprofundus ferrooxydans]
MSQLSHNSMIRQRAIALAAITQAVYLVDSIARKGLADAEDCRTLMNSLFADTVRAEHDVAQLYDGITNLQTGLRICSSILKGDTLPQHKTIMSYSAGLMALESKLTKENNVRQTLASGMQRIAGQKKYFGDAMHPNIVAAVADLYGETISTMKPRIIVRGKSEHLSQQANTRRVRALLMAGLRAAHLWHRQGGGHMNLLFRRNALAKEMDALLHIA